MSLPLVSVICLCYNHATFVRQSVLSAMAQEYSNVEIIVVDDASTDDSRAVIAQLKEEFPSIVTVYNSKNLGNCRAFNIGFKLSKGQYIIDLAADDVLLPTMVARGVANLQQHGNDYGVSFSDAWLIAPNGVKLKGHYDRDTKGILTKKIPQGDVFADIISRYFLCAPTMLMRREVLDSLGGYDEDLSYEDFDFWVRSSRQWKYCFVDDILVEKRILPHSLSSQQFKRNSIHDQTTYYVCYKVLLLCKTTLEYQALLSRCIYEAKHALWRLDFTLAGKYLLLSSKVVWKIL